MTAPAPMLTSREKSELILCHLFYSPQTTHDLADMTGLDSIEVSRLIFELKKPGYIVSQEVPDIRNGETKVKHALTDAGKMVSPDPARYLAKHKPFAGLRHIQGVAGKFDPSKPLKGARARLYAACTREMTANELSAAANVELATAFTQLNLMTRLGILQAIERPNTSGRGRSTRLNYVRKMQCVVDDDVLSPPDEKTELVAKHEPIPMALMPLAAPIPTEPVDGHKNVQAAIDDLLTRFSWSEVLLEIIVRTQERMDELQRFHDSIMNRAKEAARL